MRKEKNTETKWKNVKMVVLGFPAIILLLAGTIAIGVVEKSTATSIENLKESVVPTHPWPMFKHDARHTGQSEYNTSMNNGTKKWAFSTKGYVRSPVIASDGTIYVGSSDNNLYAIYPNGTKKWAFSTGSWNCGTPGIGSDGTIYVGSWGSKVYAINPNGTKKWEFSTNASVMAEPTIASDGTIYVVSPDGKLYVINPNGTKKWTFSTSGFGCSSPAIASDGTIYLGSSDNNLYAIYPNGTKKWTFTTGDWLHLSSPAIASDGTIYVGSCDSNLYAINPNGTKKWAFTTGGDVSSPSIASDGTIYVGSCDRNLYAIYPNGTKKWTFTTGKAVLSSPAIGSEGTIYVGSGDHNLYAINPDGTIKWTFSTGGCVISSPAIALDGTIYVGSHDCNLYAIGGKDTIPPTIISTNPPDGAVNVPVNTKITVTFSEPMMKSSVETAFTVTPAISGSFIWSSPHIAVFAPTSPLTYQTTYKVTIDKSAKDLAGNEMMFPYTWTFVTESSASKGWVIGIVVDYITHGPIPLATVDAKPGTYTTQTNSSGFYVLEVPPGNYTVTASKAGYKSASEFATVYPGQPTTVNFTLIPSATLWYIKVSPDPATCKVNETIQFTAQGYDSNDQPISGLTYVWSVTTNIGTIDQKGLFHATAKGSGYVIATATYQGITKNGQAYVDVKERTITITGKVTDSDGKPIENAKVTLTSTDGTIKKETKTDKKGIYVFTNLPADKSYTITIAMPGYNDFSYTVTPVSEVSDYQNTVVLRGSGFPWHILIMGSVMTGGVIGLLALFFRERMR